MIILDTNHIVVLRYPEHSQHGRLSSLMRKASEDHFVTTVITLEEQMRGWLAAIARTREVHDQLLYYTRLAGLVRFFSRWELLPFDEPAADKFAALRRQKIRVSTMDLKIASIALVHGAKRLSANLRDFENVPGLKVEDWLGPGS
jgi:tRNA(fMet)-specific endonuclease VapC